MSRVLSEAVAPAEGAALWAKRVALVALGVAAMAVAAKIKVPMWPVPITMQSFVVLSIGAAYGFRLGGVTMLAYLLVGAVGFDVFTGSSAAENGLAYMMGGTGGYLLGFVLAAGFLGWCARRGWDRSWLNVSLAMLAGNALIFAPGVMWLGVLYGWDKPILDWGLWPFMPGMVLKTALAAMVFPLAWRAVGEARG
ncbi:biotin transporter BioY [Rubrimonas cliftonensis]|uniref:Biotin transporter n=1 Tax=Rubrimonas cliftonensis TaxID=89524 RepID=A0A1H3W207_9RHOB|nr:biotin transporter BioY [Rubrimonas cliftonensis]SDZ81069.1 biotin transport system substrate-specific component [Rubrimonas cliftonensis]